MRPRLMIAREVERLKERKRGGQARRVVYRDDRNENNREGIRRQATGSWLASGETTGFVTRLISYALLYGAWVQRAPPRSRACLFRARRRRRLCANLSLSLSLLDPRLYSSSRFHAPRCTAAPLHSRRQLQFLEVRGTPIRISRGHLFKTVFPARGKIPVQAGFHPERLIRSATRGRQGYSNGLLAFTD